MPNYLFLNERTGEVREVFQHMNEPHVYSSKGVRWRRVWAVPQAAEGTRADPFSSADFVNQTGRKKGTMGDLWDQAKEASQKRKDKEGHDPLEKNYFKEWSEKRCGRKHSEAV